MNLILLFICTGNTCRSPMAQGLAQRVFGPEVEVRSAGLEAWDGDAPSLQAIQVMQGRGLDISGHQAQRVQEEQVAEADWVIPMTKEQENLLRRRFPHLAFKIKCLGAWSESGQDIIDPWGGSLAAYQKSAEEIEKLLYEVKVWLNLH